MEEKDVIQGLRDHNPDALKEIQELYKNQIIPMIIRKFGFRSDEIEDIVSETFIDVWLTKPKFESLIHIRRYLYRTAINKSLNLVKEHQSLAKRDKGLAYMLDHQQATPEEQRKKEYLNNYVFSCFDELPPRSREVLTLMCFENLSPEEIANKLNITVENVYQARSRGIKMLRQLGNNMPDDPNMFTFLIALLIQYYLDQQL